jgi:hypothetical protein
MDWDREDRAVKTAATGSKPAYAGLHILKSVQADFVSIAAISNRLETERSIFRGRGLQIRSRIQGNDIYPHQSIPLFFRNEK